MVSSTKITSLQNPRVKHLVKLQGDRKARTEAGLALVEGFDEISLAVAGGHVPMTLVRAPSLATEPAPAESRETLLVSESVFRKLTYRENPDGWLGVFRTPRRDLDQLEAGNPALILVLDGVEKPGNIGAILRTADAAGVDAVILSDGRVDLWNPNVVRASRGAVFTVEAVEAEADASVRWIRAHGLRIVAASPSAPSNYVAADLRGPLAIAVGAEDVGLSDFWLRQADLTVSIPMRGHVNSLNASVAAALLIYEVVRQRGSA